MIRAVVPLAVGVLLVGLFFLLPQREALPPDDLRALPTLPELALHEPPSWALSRGYDEIARNLDRLDWGAHETIQAAYEALEPYAGHLLDRLLGRLEGLSPGHFVMAEKYLHLLAHEDLTAPGVLEELTERAHSPFAIEARTALKILGLHPDPEALMGIAPRLSDADLTVRAAARAAIAKRAELGDANAQRIVFEDVAANPSGASLHFVHALRHLPGDEEVVDLLETIRVVGTFEARLIATKLLAMRGVEDAIAEFEMMIAGGDSLQRANALRLCRDAGVIVGRGEWHRILTQQDPVVVLPTLEILALALERGGEDRAVALDLLEQVLFDPAHVAHEEVLVMLLRRGHPLALQTAQAALHEARGFGLGVVVDRIIEAGVPPESFAPIAWLRLEDPTVSDADLETLCRFLSHVDPEGSADVVVGYALQESPRSTRRLADSMIQYLPRLGRSGLAELESRLDTDRGAALYVYVAGLLREPSALEALRTLALDDTRDDRLRMLAMDGIARLRAGPREDALRAIALAADDDRYASRARLLVWNYL